MTREARPCCIAEARLTVRAGARAAGETAKGGHLGKDGRIHIAGQAQDWVHAVAMSETDGVVVWSSQRLAEGLGFRFVGL